MRVVLFCGGLGMRLRDYSESIPKPMIPIGDKPILWHLMQYYSSFGFLRFVLALQNGGPALATSLSALFNSAALLVIFTGSLLDTHHHISIGLQESPI